MSIAATQERGAPHIAALLAGIVLLGASTMLAGMGGWQSALGAGVTAALGLAIVNPDEGFFAALARVGWFDALVVGIADQQFDAVSFTSAPAQAASATAGAAAAATGSCSATSTFR